MAYKLDWEKLYCGNDIEILEEAFNAQRPKVCAFDTETTGLNIIKDKPFLMILSWKEEGLNKGTSAVIHWSIENANRIFKLMSTCKYIVMQNTSFDLHMVRNGGAPFPFEMLNENCVLTDNLITTRLTVPTDSPYAKTLGLKTHAVKYIDSNANATEMDVKTLFNRVKASHRAALNTALEPIKWSKSKIDKFLNTGANIIYDLPDNVREIYFNWMNTMGEGNYYDVFLKYEVNMVNYAFNDGIYTLELFLLNFDKIQLESTELLKIFQQESKLVRVYYEQEMHGFSVDLHYLNTTRHKLWDYIQELEQELYELWGSKVSSGQHKVLIEGFINRFNVPLSVFEVKGAETGKLIVRKHILRNLLEVGGEVKRIAEVLIILRTAKKWLSTYLKGFIKSVIENGDYKFHPSIQQTGTITGRITSNMQQTPGYAFYSHTGEELYHPRKAIIPSGNGYDTLVFQDFDQMELRVQAHYTMIAGYPDINLLSLFVPYGKFSEKYGTYDMYNNQHKAAVGELVQEGSQIGTSIWRDPITFQPWVPQDPHGMHVVTAFGITPEHPDWKSLRDCAKTINFVINYGGGLNALLDNPKLESYPESTITKIYDAYHTNFAGVTNYKKWVGSIMNRDGKMSNVYGRVYKQEDPRRFSYRVGNYLVQGSSADLVKDVLLEVDAYFTKHRKLKSRLIYTIHDEFVWEMYEGEEHVIQDIDDILSKAGDWCIAPLTCGVETTKTNWAEKKGG